MQANLGLRLQLNRGKAVMCGSHEARTEEYP